MTITEQPYLDRFREIAGDHSSDVLVEFCGTGGFPHRLQYAGDGQWIVESLDLRTGEWARAYGISDYEAACIVMRQLGEWLDKRHINIVRYKQTGRFTVWADGTLQGEYGKHPDRPTAQLAAFAAEIGAAA